MYIGRVSVRNRLRTKLRYRFRAMTYIRVKRGLGIILLWTKVRYDS